MAHRTAPEGYSSNYSAILDLLRYGFALWTAPQMAVLLFHAERSTAVGRESDQHSQSQAESGIFSVRELRWIRGPAGVSLATWKRANAELSAEEKDQAGNVIRKAVLRRVRRTNRFGRDDATEYEIDWPVVKARVQKWQRDRSGGVAQAEPLAAGAEGLTVSHSEAVASLGGDGRGGPVAQSEPHSLTLTLDSHSRSRAREEIRFAIEQASGDRPQTDGLLDHVIDVTKTVGIPLAATCRWIHDFCYEKRAAGKKVTAGLVKKAIGEDILAWTKNNRALIVQIQRAERQREAEQHAAKTMPATTPANPDPMFAENLIRDGVAKVKKLKGA